jgi:phosphatidylserine/phosphatidylglycerophosphate/cardiolipin synthase-like enzyme
MNLHLISTFVLAAHWLIVAGLSIRVIMRRPPVGVSLAWLAVISSAPFVGALAYLLFGERRLGRLRAARIAASLGKVQQWQAHQRHQYDAAAMQIEATAEPIYRHAEHVLGFPILTGNNIELLDNFQTVFDAIVADIDAAQSRCHVCFYIWHEGGRTAEVVDDRVAYTGSQNLVDPRFFKQKSGVGEWVDAIARITGPSAAALDTVFGLDWSVETGRTYELPPTAANGSPSLAGSMVQVVPSGPDLQPEAIHQLLLTAIYAARRELVMTTPYFVPDESMLTALLSAALRGVEVTLIVPARNDSMLVGYASVTHFDDLMSAGANIALFKGGLLHTKSLTIDGAISVFGSVNLDMRSLWLNFEISLFVYDAAFTRQLVALQQTYIRNSDRLELDVWRRRPALRKFTENMFRLLGPLL